MEKCDAVGVTRHEKKLNGVAMGSIIGGWFHERPQLNVGVWKRQLQDEGRRAARFIPRVHGNSLLPHHQQTEVTEKPRGTDLNLESLDTNKMSRHASPGRKIKFIEKLFSALNLKKTETTPKNESQKRYVRFEEVTSFHRHTGPPRDISPQKHRGTREEQEIELNGSDVAESVRRMSTTSRRDRTPDRSSHTSASNAIPIPRPKDVRKHVDQKMEGWGSETSMLSSRASDINFGSIIEQTAPPPPVHVTKTAFPRPQKQSRRFQPSPPQPNTSWQSDSRSQCRSSTIRQPSQGTATSSSTSRHVQPLPASFKSIIPPTFTVPGIRSDFARNRERRRAERNENIPALSSQQANPAPRDEPDRRVISPVASDLRARRAERGCKLPGTEKYHRDERERLWSSQKA